MLHLINWEALRTRRARFLLLDLSMLSLAVIHLLLLAFDATYFQLRPFYYHALPALTRNYDLLKGVEPHRDTLAFQQAATDFFAACHARGQVAPAQKQQMLALSEQLIELDPFARAHLSGQLEIIKAQVRSYTGIHDSSKQAFRAFWNESCQQLNQREAFFRQQISPHLAVNFWRRIGTNSEFIDHFVYVDLGFISIFLLEFLISWWRVVKRQGKEQKVLYPLARWYDLVSCIPLQQFRFLRLLRILAIYYRLIRSQVILIHNSRIYQSVLKYQAIVMEEISDRVAIRILSNIQAKTRLGGNRTLIEDTLRANRYEIRDVIVANLQRVELPTLALRQHELVETLTSLVMQSLKATDEYKRLAALPLVSHVLDSVINQERIAHMSEQSLVAVQQAWEQKLQSPEMKILLSDLIDDVIDQTLLMTLDQRIQDLLEDISLEILEDLKEASTTSKIWKTKQDELVFERVAEREEEQREAGEAL